MFVATQLVEMAEIQYAQLFQLDKSQHTKLTTHTHIVITWTFIS